MSRVYSAKIAGIKAADEGLSVPGSVMASDAFFPFRDGIDAAADAGITAVIQPGGSMRDAEVIEAANEPVSRWSSPACATSATSPLRGLSRKPPTESHNFIGHNRRRAPLKRASLAFVVKAPPTRRLGRFFYGK